MAGKPKNVFVSPYRYVRVADAENALRIGTKNPNGATAPPTHRIMVDTSGAQFIYGGNVAGGSGSELVTRQALPVIRVERLMA